MAQLLSALLAAVAFSLPLAASAAPQSYAVSFAMTQGTLQPTTSSFTYEAGLGFSAFTVTWNGVTVDLTAAANKPTLFSTAGGYTTGTASDSLALLLGTLPQPRTYTNWAAFNAGGTATYFGFSSGSGQSGVNESLVAFSQTFPAVGADPTNQIMSGSFNVTAVPEPATALLFLTGAGCLVGLRRRRSSL